MKNYTLLLTVSYFLTACNPIGVSENEYEGAVLLGPEAFYFIEKGSNEKWWVDKETLKADGWGAVDAALNMQPECSLSTMPCKHQSITVVGMASLTWSGSYGHLGKYSHAVTFSRISVAKLESNNGL